MPQNDSNELIEKFEQFRCSLYDCFDHRQDTVMDLLDALASNSSARSPVELSLSPLFQRDYSALYKAIAEAIPGLGEDPNDCQRDQQVQQLLKVIAQVVPQPQKRPFQLLGLDVTPVARPYARTLSDRTFIYQPNTIKGNKPVNIGHPYSILSVLPEKVAPDQAPWSIPLSGVRVGSEQNASQVGSDQISLLLNHPSLVTEEQFYVLVVDSSYSNRPFLYQQGQHENLVTVARVRSNRVFYQSPLVGSEPLGRGHPTWYGERFDLKDETTWHQPDETIQTPMTTYRGRELTVTVKAWNQMLMRGTKDCPMHLHPFTLLQIRVTDEEGKQIWRPMWLIVIGQHRDQLTVQESWSAYRQRYDLEHFLRFGKQRLLLTAFQTPEVEHEENWVQLTLLAYVQLWAARELAVNLPRSWERYLPSSVNGQVSPTVVQRDFGRIISQIGTPASSPQRRGKSPGRAVGQSQPRRRRHQVVKKEAKRSRKSAIAA